jgi:DNA polymerase I-like protein with 3'-5' exonuclease and polymerase domains
MLHPSIIAKYPGYRQSIVKDLNSIVKMWESLGTKMLVGDKPKYTIVEDYRTLDRVVGQTIDAGKLTAFDIETTGLSYFDPGAKIVSLSWSNTPRTGIVVPLYHRESPFSEFRVKKVVKRLRQFFESSVPKAGQNVKFDMGWLEYWMDCPVNNVVFDTILAHYLAVTEEQGTHDLSSLAWEYTDMGGYDAELIEFKDKLPENIKNNYDNIPWEILKLYSVADSDCCRRLCDIFIPLIGDNDKWQTIMDKQMIPLTYALKDCHHNGMKFDVELNEIYRETYREELNRRYEGLHNYPEVSDMEREKLNAYAKRAVLLKAVKKSDRTEEQQKFIDSTSKFKDYKFNFGSTAQLGELLFDRLGLTTKELTDSGALSTNEDVLLEMAKHHDLPAQLLKYRQISTINNMFISALGSKVDATGLVHPSFSIPGTVTRRLSSENPNAQQFPRQGEKPEEFLYNYGVKKLFPSRFGNMGVIVQTDYSQLELRIACGISGDTVMCDLFSSGIDMHTGTASTVFNIPIDEVTKDDRTKAKAVNFGRLTSYAEVKPTSKRGRLKVA